MQEMERDGKRYKKNKQIKYRKNTNYRIKLKINFSKHTYDIFIKTDNNPEVKLGNNFKFRSEQRNLNSINNLAHYTRGNNNNLTVNNITFTTTSNTTIDLNRWINHEIKLGFGADILTFVATPSATNINGVIGFSQGEADEYKDLALIVRFAPDGYIDARDGSIIILDYTSYF